MYFRTRGKTMKKIAILIAFLLSTNIVLADPTFDRINKCTKIDDRLICSQDFSEITGFVFFFGKHKLYALRHFTSMFSNGEEFSVLTKYKCKQLVTSGNPKNADSYTCPDSKVLESFTCDRSSHTITHKYQDKYGFWQKENLEGDADTFCIDEFKKLLP